MNLCWLLGHKWDYTSKTWTVVIPEKHAIFPLTLHFRYCKKCDVVYKWKGGWWHGRWERTVQKLFNATEIRLSEVARASITFTGKGIIWQVNNKNQL